MKKYFRFKVLVSVLSGVCLVLPAYADGDGFSLCAKTFPNDDVGRLKCFDKAASPAIVSVLLPAAAPREDENAVPVRSPVAKRSYLTRTWNLDDKTSHDETRLGRLVPHRQSYLMMSKSSNVNGSPASPSAGHRTLAPLDLDALESKFQLSFKADIGSQRDINIWGFKTMRVWGAYTQQSNWQVLNARNSSPFRETNYEPELIATFGTGNESGLKLVNLGVAHQSNGHRVPESRSWNRVYVQGGWEWNNSTSILARGWYRIPENPTKDDNPDITSYVGLAELVARWEPADKSQAVLILLRNNLSWVQNRGFVQFDWALPIALGNASRVHAQITSGFGESLIDYNHRQTTFGLGFSFREW
ncbi:MAG: phospholipase A [Gallionella sp.]|nr:phospholipase A [Gallionella sp.]